MQNILQTDIPPTIIPNIHPSIPTFIHLHSCTTALHPFTQLHLHNFHQYMYPFIHPYMHSSMHHLYILFIHLCIHHSFIHLCIHPSIHSSPNSPINSIHHPNNYPPNQHKASLTSTISVQSWQWKQWVCEWSECPDLAPCTSTTTHKGHIVPLKLGSVRLQTVLDVCFWLLLHRGCKSER